MNRVLPPGLRFPAFSSEVDLLSLFPIILVYTSMFHKKLF